MILKLNIYITTRLSWLSKDNNKQIFLLLKEFLLTNLYNSYQYCCPVLFVFFYQVSVFINNVCLFSVQLRGKGLFCFVFFLKRAFQSWRSDVTTYFESNFFPGESLLWLKLRSHIINLTLFSCPCPGRQIIGRQILASVL